jgi:outer membrane biosynthesis protein TonB
VAKAKRTQKLKVFRTPIGFHDAYVAAPSQKAALEAWGSATNLFGQGAAEQVTDAELIKVPLENPGQVVKVLRGSRAEQIAALDKQKEPKRTEAPKAEIVGRKPKKRPPKPSRTAVTKAEEALAEVEKRQADEMARLEEQRKAVEQKVHETRRRQERERDKAQADVERRRSEYESALERYESG